MANAKQAAGYSTWDNIGPSEPLKCDRYYTDSANHTHFIYGGYEGIPENLLINLAIWLVGGALRNAIPCSRFLGAYDISLIIVLYF